MGEQPTEIVDAINKLTEKASNLTWLDMIFGELHKINVNIEQSHSIPSNSYTDEMMRIADSLDSISTSLEKLVGVFEDLNFPKLE